ncbi:hypothetical protein GCK72_013121 [Caenorhabditis remanei]|uniref:Uncharacterized protein n=1 Tax=Caenorhabditis remanei TaxID=31234 RepID=A0A6A5GMX2_CAERE|nr:hypothetical protein GCK72_013121 [Caenorhabditis remanei]KAF1756667.1 hypothetical protein GCK72_013121 [Caenorhabditis remanei]
MEFNQEHGKGSCQATAEEFKDHLLTSPNFRSNEGLLLVESNSLSPDEIDPFYNDEENGQSTIHAYGDYTNM